MPPISIQRVGARSSWSLIFTGRSRSVAIKCSTTGRARRSPHSSRSLSSASRLWQESSTPSNTRTSNSTSATASDARKSTAAPKSFAAREAPPPTARQQATSPSLEPIRDITKGFSDDPASIPSDSTTGHIDWTTSFHGISSEAFSKEAADILLQPLNVDDIEVKPDGIVYLPEIKYRRILNKAFGPGGWGLAPRGETIVTPKSVTREYALLANGRLVSISRGEQDYFDPEGIATATEGCKSNALMRCCKDLGIASELWDPRFIRKFLATRARETWVEHAVTKKKRKMYLRKDDEVKYPFKEVKSTGASGAFA